jgi:colanic acid/amylovoran biosynthesis glycosyltransferase
MNFDSPQKSLRISMVVSGFPVLSQTFVSLQLTELVRRGHQADVYSLGRRGQWNWLPASIGDALDNVRIRHLGTRSRKRRINFLLVPKLLFLLTRSPKAVWLALKEVLLKSGYKSFTHLISDAYLMRDLLHAETDLVHCQFGTLIPRVLKLRELGFIDDRPTLACSVRGYDITRGKYRDPEYLATVFEGVDHFFPVCRALETLLRKQGCRRPISIIRSPVDVDYIQSIQNPRRPGAKLQLVSIGRLIEKKGIIDALGAMLILKAKGIDFAYSIIGDGKSRKSLVDFVGANGLADHVQFLGPLPSAETLRILESSDVLIAPSKTAEDGNSEGIPNVLKEAMLIGVQVIGTTHAGIPELIQHGENGYLSAENDPEGLARVIELVAGNADAWEKIAERAERTILSEYTPEKTTDDLVEAYRIAIG